MKKSVMITVMLSCIPPFGACHLWLAHVQPRHHTYGCHHPYHRCTPRNRPPHQHLRHQRPSCGRRCQLPLLRRVGGAVECSCRCGIPFRLPLRLGYLRHVGSLPVGREYPRLHFRPPLVWHEMGKQKFHTELIFLVKPYLCPSNKQIMALWMHY